MLPGIAFSRIGFEQPEYLWLLVAPVLMLAWWWRRLLARLTDRRRLMARRTLPVTESLSRTGELPFWLCLILAIACLVVALARPHGPATLLRQGGIDLMVLQDASASMRVADVAGDRYQRSMAFLRLLGDTLSWKSDRVSLSLFARIVAPQVRLTSDPNTLFFFFDHLDKQPPFRVDEDTTWDTNLELGIRWGLRMLERDEKLHGKSANAKMFLVLSDGELWSGEVKKAIADSVARNVPVFVVGVGTLGGGKMPIFHDAEGQPVRDPTVPTHSRLDRDSLQTIARAGGGQYFELDRDGDRRIASAIVDAGKRLAPTLAVGGKTESLYWYCLVMAAGWLCIGLLFLRDTTNLRLQFAALTVTLLWFWHVTM